MHQICVRSLVALRRIVYKIYQQYPCLAGQRSLPLGLIVNADSMLVRNPASLGIENQRTKCVKMFRSNCIDFSPTTTTYYAYSTIKAPDKGEVGGSSPPRPTIQITSKYPAILALSISRNMPAKPFVNDLSTFGIAICRPRRHRRHYDLARGFTDCLNFLLTATAPRHSRNGKNINVHSRHIGLWKSSLQN